MASGKINLIVAVCSNKGIGIKGKLPWQLKGDLAFFKRITSETKCAEKTNAVIMGRKTWESIPEKFRPLPNRLNIVISRTLQGELEGVPIVKSFEDALQIIEDRRESIETTFVIGGHSIYKLALESDKCHRVYMTRVLADFECDTHMPDLDTQHFKMVTDEAVKADVQTENDISYKFEVYEKIDKKLLKLKIMVAFVDDTRGFGFKGKLPWPFIRNDFEYYMDMTTRRKNADKKNCYLKGKHTWLSTSQAERSSKAILNMVISTSLRCTVDDHIDHVCDSLSSALAVMQEKCAEIENVWVMGGQQLYKQAISLPQCTQLYATRIFHPFQADRFFPPFEHLFALTENDGVCSQIQEDNGIKFRFEVFERNHLTF